MLYFHLHLNECAGVAQSVEQLIRNQQVMCSSHTTSSKKHRKLWFSMLFCCKKAEKVWVKMWVNCLTHTLTHTGNKLYPRKWTRDFDPWPRSADTHLTHRVSQWLCRLLPAHALWVRGNIPIDLKSTGEEAFAFSPVFLFFSAYMTCAMKLPMVCAASSCFCLVAWV